MSRTYITDQENKVGKILLYISGFKQREEILI